MVYNQTREIEMRELIFTVLILAGLVGAWYVWYSKTFAQRSIRVLLAAWPTMAAFKDGRQFVGAQSELVFYRCRQSWKNQRADFTMLGKTHRGQWFEATTVVFAAHKVAPLVIERVMSPAEAQEWLGRFQAGHAEIARRFGPVEVA